MSMMCCYVSAPCSLAYRYAVVVDGTRPVEQLEVVLYVYRKHVRVELSAVQRLAQCVSLKRRVKRSQRLNFSDV